MRLLPSILLLSLLTFSTSFAQTVPAPPLQCVRVRSVDTNGASLGTGALITARHVATANHVVCERKDDDSIEVIFPDGQVIPGRVLATDEPQDIAIIQILPESITFKIPPYKISNQELTVGDTYWIMGYGSGTFKAQKGTLNGIEYSQGWREIDDAEARSGDSGGPVTDAQGRYVGVLWGGSHGTTFFTPLDILMELFDEVAPGDITPVHPLTPYYIRGR